MTYPISLAAGNLPEFAPREIYNAAVTAGYDLSGMWVDLTTWTDETTKELKRALDDSDVGILDVEVMWIQPGESVEGLKRTIDIGAELGAQFGLVVSSDPNPANTKRGFEDLCKHAEQVGLVLVLEPLPITEVKNLAAALEIVSDVGHPSGKLLIDTLHFQRGGTTLAELQEMSSDWFPYVQIADAPLQIAEPTFENLMHEAVDGRLLPGEGELPIRDVLKYLAPGLPISPEIRSAAVRETYPDAAERAKSILEATRHFLAN